MNGINMCLLWFGIGIFYGFIQEKYPKFYLWFALFVILLIIPITLISPTSVLDLGEQSLSNWWYVPMIISTIIGNLTGKDIAIKLEEI